MRCGWVAALAAAVLAGTASAADAPRFIGFREYVLHFGANHIAHFGADGRPATIIKAWRGNGNAYSYDLFVVTMPGGERDEAGAWNLVGDPIADAPHTGEDMVTSIRFGSAIVAGRRQTVLVKAHRELATSHSVPDASRTQIEIYTVTRSEALGTADQFKLVASFRTRGLYCHADAALKGELGIQLPSGYAGTVTKDGCIQ